MYPVWTGRRALLGARCRRALREANRWLARLLFVDLALLIVSGVLLWDADPRHPLTLASYRALHGVATDLFLPTLCTHLSVGAWLKLKGGKPSAAPKSAEDESTPS